MRLFSLHWLQGLKSMGSVSAQLGSGSHGRRWMTSHYQKEDCILREEAREQFRRWTHSLSNSHLKKLSPRKTTWRHHTQWLSSSHKTLPLRSRLFPKTLGSGRSHATNTGNAGGKATFKWHHTNLYMDLFLDHSLNNNFFSVHFFLGQ